MRRSLYLMVLSSTLVGLVLLLLASPAAAASVACGDTITTGTTLTADLTGCAQGLTVAAR